MNCSASVTSDAHKHHALLLSAYARLDRPRPPLRLIGDPDVDPANYRRIAELASKVDGVVVDGRVSFEHLIEAYGRARAMVIASDRESFSMPVAEALTCGVPIVAREYPTFRETAGPGAIFVSGDDVDGWTAAIGRTDFRPWASLAATSRGARSRTSLFLGRLRSGAASRA